MFIVILALCFTLTAGAPNQARIGYGDLTTIKQYPSMAAVLHSRDLVHYWQACGGIIISYSSVLTAAHCVYGYRPVNFRFRVGSSFANHGGTVHEVYSMIWHHNFNTFTNEHDIVMIRTDQSICISHSVQYAKIPNTELYELKDDEPVWATGWGSIFFVAPPIEQLHRTQMLTLNLDTCKDIYENHEYPGRVIADHMICTKNFVPNIPADTCLGDDGGPLYHNGVAVGVASAPSDCGNSNLPAVYTFIPKYLDWIYWNSL